MPNAFQSISKITVVLSYLLVVQACDCSGSKPTSSPKVEVTEVVKPHKPANHADELYDEKGLLRDSGKKVAGLPLPVALTETISEEKRHVYRTHVPINKVLKFFGPKLFTVQVDRHGEGAIYRNAKVLRSKSQSLLEVSILPITGRKTRIEIREIPPKSANVPKPTQVLERSVREHFNMYD